MRKKQYPRLRIYKGRAGSGWHCDSIWYVRQIKWFEDHGEVLFEARTFEGARKFVVDKDPKSEYQRSLRRLRVQSIQMEAS